MVSRLQSRLQLPLAPSDRILITLVSQPAVGTKGCLWKAETQMLFDGRLMEDEKVDQQEVWSAIRYLDPDEKDKDKKGASNTTTIIAALALLFIVCAVWVLLWLRLAEP